MAIPYLQLGSIPHKIIDLSIGLDSNTIDTSYLAGCID